MIFVRPDLLVTSSTRDENGFVANLALFNYVFMIHDLLNEHVLTLASHTLKYSADDMTYC